MNNKAYNNVISAEKSQTFTKNKNNMIKNFHDTNNTNYQKIEKIPIKNSEFYVKNKIYNFSKNSNSNQNHSQNNFNINHEKAEIFNSNIDQAKNKMNELENFYRKAENNSSNQSYKL